MKGGAIYIMTNRKNGTLYVGVTSDLIGRAYRHRNGLVEGFTKQHGLKLLVYFEQFDDIRTAIQREKTHQALAASLEDQAHSCGQSGMG